MSNFIRLQPSQLQPNKNIVIAQGVNASRHCIKSVGIIFAQQNKLIIKNKRGTAKQRCLFSI